MLIRSRRTFVSLCLATLFLAPLPAAAQPAGGQTGTQFYTAFREAFAKARTIDELLPMMAKAQRDQVQATPAAERGKMFAFLKEMNGDLTDVKVLKETPSASGATLEAEAVHRSDKTKAKGQITLVKEAGAWKVGRENWSSGS